MDTVATCLHVAQERSVHACVGGQWSEQEQLDNVVGSGSRSIVAHGGRSPPRRACRRRTSCSKAPPVESSDAEYLSHCGLSSRVCSAICSALPAFGLRLCARFSPNGVGARRADSANCGCDTLLYNSCGSRLTRDFWGAAHVGRLAGFRKEDASGLHTATDRPWGAAKASAHTKS